MAEDPRYIRIEGLAELRKALAEVDDSLVDIVAVANKKVANMVASKAALRAAALGRRGAVRAASTLRTGSLAREATLRLGNKATPGALGEEFGSYRNITRATTRRGRHVEVLGWRQFQGWRGAGSGAGYWLWPTIRDNRDEIRETHEQELDRLILRTFPGGTKP